MHTDYFINMDEIQVDCLCDLLQVTNDVFKGRMLESVCPDIDCLGANANSHFSTYMPTLC